MFRQYVHNQRPDGVLLGTGAVLNVSQGRAIYEQGNAAELLLQVVSGTVRACKFMSDGRRQIDAFYRVGDIFGFETSALHSLTAEAVSDCRLVSYRSRNLSAMALQQQAFAYELYGYAIRSLAKAQEHSRVLGRTRAVEKLAAFLIECSEYSPSSDMISLVMVRHDIADYLGLTVETVSRTLTQLRQDGLINLTSAREIKITDMSGLQNLNL